MPFEQIPIGEWLIEVDRQATQEAYRSGNLIISACTCADCENFYAAGRAGKAHSAATLTVFQRLGIAPEKVTEVYTFYGNQEKTLAYYGGFYHLVGRIIEKPRKPGYTLIDDHFGVLFTEQMNLLAQTFPQPALQMEFAGLIPWVLEKQRNLLASLPLVFP